MSSFSFYPNALRDIDRAAARALEMTAEAVHTEVVQAQVIPRDTGVMQNDRTFIKAGETVSAEYPSGATATNTITNASGGKVEIIMSSPQVRRLYFHPEYDFSKDENPNAQAHWFDPWMDGGENADFVLNTFAKFLKQGAGL